MSTESRRPLKITLLTFGSRGDIQPYIALSVGLKAAGYIPTLAAPATFRELVESQGVAFHPLPGNPEALSRGFVGGAGKLPKTAMVMAEAAIPIAAEMISEVMTACEGADAVIHAFMMVNAGHEAARHHGIPDIGVHPYPVFSETEAFPNMMFPRLGLGPLYNRLTHRIFIKSFWWGSRAGYGLVRISKPDLPELHGWPFDMEDVTVPQIIAASESVIGRMPDRGEHTHISGFLILPLEEGYEPPEDLVDFLEAGEPPVYIGFGSMVADQMEMMALEAIDALEKAGQRGILYTGWGGLTSENTPDFIYKMGGVPHEWLFPLMKAIVHHGGAGTTAASLRSGVPTIVVPFAGDQGYWGSRVRDLGVGPDPIPRKDLTAKRLAYAIRVACSHKPMRRAARLGEKLRAEDGVAETVKLIDRYLIQ